MGESILQIIGKHELGCMVWLPSYTNEEYWNMDRIMGNNGE